ncbi:MAG: nicotinamide-nucleotide adenylyltransferase [Candidatus Lokiarchaeota archaeon]|nr:nicotinamide-nucleotide adenylyltransferase [Candidatus Lokiarchaeota archaeon]
MEDEIIACIREENAKYLQSGQISKYVFPLKRKEAHDKKIPHLIIRLFAVAFDSKNEVFYLVQKRSKHKRSYPEYFTDTASGHVLYQKNLDLNAIKINALRELEEEFGVAERHVKKVKFCNLKEEEDNLTKEISYTFLAVIDRDVMLVPDPIELDEHHSRFYTQGELEIILQNEKNIDRSKKIWKLLMKTNINDLFERSGDNGAQKSKIGLFIGRFQPLHHGHVFVLRNILNSCKKIKIGIGSSQLSDAENDPFSGDERRQFIEAALKRRNISPHRYEIFNIPDIFNAKKWISHVISIVGDIDVVYSNSNWVRALFSNEGYVVGKKIEIFKKKFNSSHVRQLIKKDNKSWKKLVPKEVIELMLQFNGLERIIHSSEKKSE